MAKVSPQTSSPGHTFSMSRVLHRTRISQKGRMTTMMGRMRPSMALKSASGRPVTATRVRTGLPMPPQATGAELAMRHMSAVWKGGKRRPIIMAPVTATGAPPQPAPSRRAPKAKVYVSPLKALSNDVHKNLELPLAEILALAAKRGVALAPIRAALRTGDTRQADRGGMARQRPHILVTTPESLYILLTAAGPRQMLASASTVIVDEIHAVADDKRGSHLALTLARLDRLVEQNGGARPRRVGLSATVRPIEDVAAFLSDGASVVNVGHRREMEIAVESPRDELGPVASTEMWGGIYDRLAE